MLRKLAIASSLLIAASASADTAPHRHPNDIPPREAPIVRPMGQVIDKTLPAYQPKFLAVQPLAGRYEERKWAYLNTYAAYPFYGYGYWGGYGCYGWSYGGLGFGGYGGSGLSIQNNSFGPP